LKINVENREELVKLINKIEQELQENHIRKATSYWNQMLKKPYKDPNTIDEERARVLLNPEYRFTIEDWLDKVDEEDVLLKRKLELLKQEFLRARVSSEPQIFALKNKLEYQIINFTPEMDGKKYSRSELYNIIEKSDNRKERKKAWEALTSLGKEIEDEVNLLVNLRNEKALALGYKSYGELSFFLEDIDRDKTSELLEQILSITEKPHRKLIEDCKEKLSTDTVYPWDIKFYQHKYLTSVDDRYFPKEGIINSIEKVLQKFRLNLKDLPITVEYCDIPYGGLSLTMEPGKDVRVLANPQEGHNWYEILYHEFGHALHNCFIEVPSFIIGAGEPSVFKEGMGYIFQKFVLQKPWLEEYLHLPNEVIDEFIRQSKIKNCYWYRRIITDCVFEYSIYEDTKGDLNKRYKEFASKNLFYELPEDFIYSYDPVYTTHPLYLQNYLLADVIAYQSINYCKSNGINIFSPEFFEFLRKYYFRDGAVKRWADKIKEATGSKLKAESLTRVIESI